MSKHNLYKVGLVAAILSAVSWFVFVYGSLNDPGISEIDDPLQLFQTLRDTGYIYLLYGWGGILGTLLAVPYIVAFYEAMKDSGPMILLSMITALIGAVLTTFGFFKPLTLVYFHLPLGLEASPEELPFLKIATNVSLELFESPWFLGSFLMFGLGFGPALSRCKYEYHFLAKSRAVETWGFLESCFSFWTGFLGPRVFFRILLKSILSASC